MVRKLFGILTVLMVVAMLAVQTVSAASTPPTPPIPTTDEVRVLVWYDLPGPDTLVGATVNEGYASVTHWFIVDDVCWRYMFVGLDAVNTFQTYPVGDYEGGGPYEAVDGIQRILFPNANAAANF